MSIVPRGTRRASGTHAVACTMPAARTTHDRLVTILERYVSRITVESMLMTVLLQRGIQVYQIDPDTILDVVGEVMIGLRLFCEESRLPDLMIELAELCDEEMRHEPITLSKRPASLPKGPVG